MPKHGSGGRTAPVIAIVDDDEGIRCALEDYLEALGYRSRLFVSAEDYLADATQTDIDCIVADVAMGGMNGLDMQRLLVGSPLARPLIFMTSHENGQMRALALRQGAVAFLAKPVAMNELARQIEKALNQ